MSTKVSLEIPNPVVKFERYKNGKVKSLVIDCDKWLNRSLHKGDSHTYNPTFLDKDGKMCCLGFLSIASGLKCSNIFEVPTFSDLSETKSLYDKEEIKGLSLLATVEEKQCEEYEEGGYYSFDSSSFSKEAMRINDSSIYIDLQERMDLLTEHFKSARIKLSFINYEKYLKKNPNDTNDTNDLSTTKGSKEKTKKVSS